MTPEKQIADAEAWFRAEFGVSCLSHLQNFLLGLREKRIADAILRRFETIPSPEIEPLLAEVKRRLASPDPVGEKKGVTPATRRRVDSERG